MGPSVQALFIRSDKGGGMLHIHSIILLQMINIILTYLPWYDFILTE